MSVRLKRLYADYKRISQVFTEHPNIFVKSTTGNPPERYQIEYKIIGLEQKGKSIAKKDHHLVDIVLTRDYPREAPLCRMLTPVFHPNIAPHVICIGDHWTAGESLANLVVRIGEMICYQSYNIKSPRNGEAAKWADENVNRLPIDITNLSLKKRPEEIVVNKAEVEEAQEEDAGEKERISTHKDQVEIQLEPRAPELGGLSEELSVASCSNCGTNSENIQFQECLNGHFVCSDCIIECQNCGKILCVRCSFSKCPVCEKIMCSECQSTCSLCKQIVCKEHIAKCSVCQSVGCTKCVFTCLKCQKVFCKSHFNKEKNHCIECAPMIEDTIKISYEELES